MAEAPGLLKLDRADRTDFLRHFYRRYEDAPVEQIEEDARELFTQLIITKSFPAGMRRVREHRALGHRTILITGALNFAVEGLRPLFDEIVAAEMSIRPDGTYSGEMITVPPTGEARAQILADYCDAEGFRLEESVAYADSSSDLPLFEAVGFPVAVNPETRLAAIARKRGWLVEHWSKSPGGPRPLLPIGPLLSERQRRERFGAASAAWGRVGRESAPGLPLGPPHRPRPHRVGGVADRRDQARPAQLRDGRRTRAARPRLAAGAHPPRRHLRIRPVDSSRVMRRCTSTMVSFPFVPGHEVVGELDDGTRVVSNRCSATTPAASLRRSAARRRGDGDDCAHLATGHLEPGLQTGFCCEPAAAGRRRSSPTPASSTRSPTTCPTSGR